MQNAEITVKGAMYYSSSKSDDTTKSGDIGTPYPSAPPLEVSAQGGVVPPGQQLFSEEPPPYQPPPYQPQVTPPGK